MPLSDEAIEPEGARQPEKHLGPEWREASGQRKENILVMEMGIKQFNDPRVLEEEGLLLVTFFVR